MDSPRTWRGSWWPAVSFLFFSFSFIPSLSEDPDVHVAPPRVLARGIFGGEGGGEAGYWVGDLGGLHVVHFVEVRLFLTVSSQFKNNYLAEM